VLVIELPLATLAVHDPGLGRVQLQPDLGHPVSDRHHHCICLPFRGAVHDGVVGIALEGIAG